MEWWKKIPDAWKIVIAVIGGITMVIGTYRGVEGYVTKRCDFEEHKKRHNMDIAEISAQTQKGFIYQDLRWNAKEQNEVKKRLEKNPNSEADQEYLEKLKMEKEHMERELMDMKNQKPIDQGK